MRTVFPGVLPKPKGARVSHPRHVPGRMAVGYSEVFCQDGAAAAENSRVPDELGNTPFRSQRNMRKGVETGSVFYVFRVVVRQNHTAKLSWRGHAGII
jgi:hypothetical protein